MQKHDHSGRNYTEKMTKKTIILATLAALTGQVIFGFTFLFTKIALNTASPLVLIADRYIVAFLAMTLVILFSGKKICYKGKKLWKVIVMALCEPTLYFICESYGIMYTTTSFSSVMIALIPVATALCGMIFLKEIPTLLQNLFIIISVAGVIIMALSGNAEGTVTLLGFVLLMGAVVSGAGYNIMSRHSSDEFTPLERTYAMVLVGLISFVTIALFESKGSFVPVFTPFLSVDYLLCIVYLGVVSSVGAFFLLNYANTYLPVAKTTSFSSVIPVVSVFAGVVFLKEHLGAVEICAAAMIILGVTGVQMFDRRKSESLD